MLQNNLLPGKIAYDFKSVMFMNVISKNFFKSDDESKQAIAIFIQCLSYKGNVKIRVINTKYSQRITLERFYLPLQSMLVLTLTGISKK